MKTNFALFLFIGLVYSCSTPKNSQTKDLTTQVESDTISHLKTQKPDTNKIYLNGKELKVSNKKGRSVFENPKIKKPSK
ncbi:MAG: hypothetical protein V4622_11015 [Bacteroidota bacterium]